MSLSDVWNEIRFFFIDVTNYTNAEQNLDKYTKIVEKLDKKIAACETALESARTDSSSISQCYFKNINSAKGEMMNHFNTQGGLWDDNRCEIIKSYTTALETAGDRRDSAAISMDYWQTEVDTEEANLRDELWNRKEEAKESTE